LSRGPALRCGRSSLDRGGGVVRGAGGGELDEGGV
jgi:hypothetical protein